MIIEQKKHSFPMHPLARSRAVYPNSEPCLLYLEAACESVCSPSRSASLNPYDGIAHSQMTQNQLSQDSSKPAVTSYWKPEKTVVEPSSPSPIVHSSFAPCPSSSGTPSTPAKVCAVSSSASSPSIGNTPSQCRRQNPPDAVPRESPVRPSPPPSFQPHSPPLTQSSPLSNLSEKAKRLKERENELENFIRCSRENQERMHAMMTARRRDEARFSSGSIRRSLSEISHPMRKSQIWVGEGGTKSRESPKRGVIRYEDPSSPPNIHQRASSVWIARERVTETAHPSMMSSVRHKAQPIFETSENRRMTEEQFRRLRQNLLDRSQQHVLTNSSILLS